MISLRSELRKARLRHFGKRTFVHRTAGFPFVCVPGFDESEFAFLYGGDDALEFALLDLWIERGSTVFDCGANIGLYAAKMGGRVGDTGKVIAFEPGPRAASHTALVRDLINLPIEIEPKAVSDQPGTATFYVAKGSAGTTSQSLVCPPASDGEHEPRKVSVTTLDEAVRRHGIPSAVKIDVEGAETLVLAGARTILSAPDPVLWLVEVNGPALARFGARHEDVLNHFDPAVHAIWVIPKFSRSGGQPREWSPGSTWEDAPFHNLAIWKKSSPKNRPLLDLLVGKASPRP